MLVSTLMILNALACAIILWFGVNSINKMSKATAKRIKWPIIATTTGVFIQLMATLDFFITNGYAWPWLLLAGETLTNVGVMLLLKFCRRNPLKRIR